METKSLFITNETMAVEEHFTEVIFRLIANKAQTRYETLEGKQHLVVPCVMITEGVHNGSQGPLYYPAEELSKNPSGWNGIPVLVYHSTMNGQSISACDPIVFDKQKIGLTFNTKWEDGKLKTECWIDEDKANEIDPRVMEAITNGNMMEVSTGLFTDHENIEGEWKGEHYDSIVRNFRPDHLAVLPDQIGACSIEDGAGLLRNAKEKDTAEGRLAGSLYEIFNELSHNDVWKELNNKIDSGTAIGAWVIDVFDDFFIYEDGDRMFYQEYEINDDDEVKLIGIRREVEKITQYQFSDGTLVGNKEDVNKMTVNQSSNLETVHNKEINMNKKKREALVNGLIANENLAWDEEDREYLMTMSDEKLTGHSKPPYEEKPAENQEEKPAEKPEEKPEEKPAEKPEENQELSMEEFIATAPEAYRDVMSSMQANHEAEKVKMIAKITANERNSFSEEQLKAKGLEELKQLAAFAEVPPTPAAPVIPVPIFDGLAETVDTNKGKDEEEVLSMPVMNFEESK